MRTSCQSTSISIQWGSQGSWSAKQHPLCVNLAHMCKFLANVTFPTKSTWCQNLTHAHTHTHTHARTHTRSPAEKVEGARALITAQQVPPIPTRITVGVVWDIALPHHRHWQRWWRRDLGFLWPLLLARAALRGCNQHLDFLGDIKQDTVTQAKHYLTYGFENRPQKMEEPWNQG